MSPIDWDQSFNTGHTEVDLQHREFLAIVNEMESLLVAPCIYDRHVRLDILEKLLELTEKHFRLEKELLHEYGCSDTSACYHWRSNKSFDAVIYALYRDILGGEFVLDSNILMVVRDEFFNHITREDNMMFRNVFFDISQPEYHEIERTY
jgi:hemerythrin-like metal-binding protein